MFYIQKGGLKAACLKELYRIVSGHVRGIKFFSYPVGMCQMNRGIPPSPNQKTEGKKCVTINNNSFSTNLNSHLKI